MLSRRPVGLATLALLTTAGAATAADWIGGSGDWNNPANWASGVVPGDGQSILVANGGTIFATDLDIQAGSGGFGGSTGDAAGDGAFVQSGGSSSWTGFGMQFGNGANTSGALTLSDAGSLQANILGFGNRGFGSGLISSSSTVTTEYLFVAGRGPGAARAFTSAGQLAITGPGTAVRVTGAFGFEAGYDGSANITIADGALLETTDAVLVSTTAAGSSITIDHATMRFSGGFGFDMGRDISLAPDHPPVGDAVLTLRNGIVEDTGFDGMLLADQSLVQGAGELRTDITVRQGATIDPGESGSFGHLSVSGLLDNAPTGIIGQSGGTLRFDIGNADAHDRLTVGALIAGGTLEVALADGFTTAFGDSFDLITITDQSAFTTLPIGAFDTVLLPDLADGLFFEVVYTTDTISLRTIPTPSTLALAGLIMLAPSRRRSQV